MGLVSLAMVGMTAFVLIGLSLLSSPGTPGANVAVPEGPGTLSLVVWFVLGVVCLTLPPIVVVMARRAWLGWMLVALAVSAFVLAVALWALGIL